VLLAICQVNTNNLLPYPHLLIFTFSIVCTTCTTTDHGPAGHEFAPLNDAGKCSEEEKHTHTHLVSYLHFIGSHQVAKLQNMVENTRQRLNDLKHSQKTVDRSFSLLQVRRLK
jgi:hypothetical protein